MAVFVPVLPDYEPLDYPDQTSAPANTVFPEFSSKVKVFAEKRHTYDAYKEARSTDWFNALGQCKQSYPALKLEGESGKVFAEDVGGKTIRRGKALCNILETHFQPGVVEIEVPEATARAILGVTNGAYGSNMLKNGFAFLVWGSPTDVIGLQNGKIVKMPRAQWP